MADDVPMYDVSDNEEAENPQHKRFILAVDFGTTYSSIAYVALDADDVRSRLDQDHVQVIDGYPDEPGQKEMDRRPEVPTELWYPKQGVQAHVPLGPLQRNLDLGDDGQSDSGQSHSSLQGVSSENLSEEELCEVDSPKFRENRFFWGYEVHTQLGTPDLHGDDTRPLTRFKLMLDDERSEPTKKVRTCLESICRLLKRNKVIENKHDLISDYLTKLFEFARKKLECDEYFCKSCQIEFVLCVPAGWSSKACRIMQAAMAKAIKASGFGRLKNGIVDNLFIVSEPDAAAAYVLGSGKCDVDAGETFVLLDAGGGTVDAITYTVEKSYPIRLKAEAVAAESALCGSSFLNEEYENLLRKRLKDEHYLERYGFTLPRIIDEHVINFETISKRNLDITNPRDSLNAVFIAGLRLNDGKGFDRNRMLITRKETEEIFNPLLEQAKELLDNQLQMAQMIAQVKKVILIGGFAQSPSLRNYLRKYLADQSKTLGHRIELVWPKLSSTAVARGAVLRAAQKGDGPARKIQSSYGFLTHELHKPRTLRAHIGVEASVDRVDGKRWVYDTIDWLIKKGETIPEGKVITRKTWHTFPVKNRRFVREEAVYVSDNYHESHYQKSHPSNKGVEVAGKIRVDFTHLRTEGYLKPEHQLVGPEGPYYKVDYELRMIVNGRNLRYDVRCDGLTQQAGEISIAAAFVPGTE